MEEACFKNYTKYKSMHSAKCIMRKKKQFFCESTNDTLACVIFVKFESRAAASVLHERERERERPEEAASRTEVTLYRYKYI